MSLEAAVMSRLLRVLRAMAMARQEIPWCCWTRCWCRRTCNAARQDTAHWYVVGITCLRETAEHQSIEALQWFLGS